MPKFGHFLRVTLEHILMIKFECNSLTFNLINNKIMLHEYQLTNFKAFADTGKIPIKPITLIYGPNSSGKTSIIQSLLLLKQTLMQATSPDVILLPSGNLTDLGSYWDFIYRHNIDQIFSFQMDLEFEPQKIPGLLGILIDEELAKHPFFGVQISFNYNQQESLILLSKANLLIGGLPFITYESKYNSSDTSCLELTIGELNSSNVLWQKWYESVKSRIINLFRKKTRAVLKEKGVKLESLSSKKIAQKLFELHQNILEQATNDNIKYNDDIEYIEILEKLCRRFENYELKDCLQDFSRVLIYSTLVLSRNFLPYKLDESNETNQNLELDYLSEIYASLDILESLSTLTQLSYEILQSFLEHSVYIGPSRDIPERYYIFNDTSGTTSKYTNSISNLLFKSPGLIERINHQFEKFELGYEIKATAYKGEEDSETSNIFAIQLWDKYNQTKINIVDVGFGISQVLPIIVQSIASHQKTIIIEQPEVHIHPRLQTQLGSLFADCIKPPFENQFIIETHSEHLMLRLQKLIRKGELKPDDVSVIYVERTLEGSKCLRLRIDNEGDFIDEWPDGFFEEDFQEIFE